MNGKIFRIARILDEKRQSEIAAKTQIPVSDLSRFENGRLILKPEQISRLEIALPRLGKAKALLD